MRSILPNLGKMKDSATSATVRVWLFVWCIQCSQSVKVLMLCFWWTSYHVNIRDKMTRCAKNDNSLALDSWTLADWPWRPPLVWIRINVCGRCVGFGCSFLFWVGQLFSLIKIGIAGSRWVPLILTPLACRLRTRMEYTLVELLCYH